MNSSVEREIINISKKKKNQNEQGSWSMNEIHLICGYLYFHGIIVCSFFWVTSLCQYCVSDVCLSTFPFCFFFFSPPKGEGQSYTIQDLKMPDTIIPKSLRNTDTQMETFSFLFFAKFEKQKSAWPPQAWFLSLMVWNLQEDGWLTCLSPLYLGEILGPAVQPTIGQLCERKKDKGKVFF